MTDQPKEAMYEAYKLCPELSPEHTCLVVEQYSEGTFTRTFHKHVPRRRLAKESRLALLRAMVIKFAGFSGEMIVGCFINARGKEPAADTGNLQIHISYPEPGVIRTYCGANTKAWSDEVIGKNHFRNK